MFFRCKCCEKLKLRTSQCHDIIVDGKGYQLKYTLCKTCAQAINEIEDVRQDRFNEKFPPLGNLDG